MTRISLPRAVDLQHLLNIGEASLSPLVTNCIERTVTAPLEEFLAKGKALRAKVVEAGFRLSRPGGDLTESEDASCVVLAQCIEAIHAGSLIIDDIQDNSKVRRGFPTMHHSQGLALALNGGNLLYFFGMRQIALAGLPAKAELECTRRLHEQLLRGHYGQALDLGVRVDEISQGDVYEFCFASMHLKTGVLMALALSLGAIAGGMASDRLSRLDNFGHLLGTGLQMFDDLNNIATCPSDDWNQAKRLEDLQLRRPTWVWAFAAKTFSASDYAEFVTAVRRLPDEASLAAWLRVHDFDDRARNAAWDFVDNACEKFEDDLVSPGGDKRALENLRALTKRFSLTLVRSNNFHSQQGHDPGKFGTTE